MSIAADGRPNARAEAGINVIGHVSGNLGLGVLARHVVEALLARGCPVSILDVDPGLGRGGHDRRFADQTVTSSKQLPHSLTFLIFPPDSIVRFIADSANRDLLLRNGALNAALVNWEQMVVPADWVRCLQALDVIVAPSIFTRNTFEQALPHVPVLTMNVPLQLPRRVTADRHRFGLQPDRVWFGSSFEPQSDPARKNPFAVIDAFQQAFPAGRDTGLVIKVNNPAALGRPHPIIEAMRARGRRDDRLVILDASLDYAGVLSFYASLDVYVSLHRSEGIGLGLMEAMYLGKPVVATGWSGNMSFMDHSNSCPVGYELVPVRGGSHVYTTDILGSQAVWADADVTSAGEWLRLLAAQPDVRAAIGHNARESIERYQAEARRARFLDELRVILNTEVRWGIRSAARQARRVLLANAAAEQARQTAPQRAPWVQAVVTVAKQAGFRRGKFPYWSPPRSGVS